MSLTKPKIAVIMITLNEAHNLPVVFKNLQGFADELFIIDSFSTDNTMQLALHHGAKVVQRKFDGFGSQWNFALQELPIQSDWVMKLDPDEYLSNELKISIIRAIQNNRADGFMVSRRLWFMGKALPVKQNILRVWRTGKCKFTDVCVNEHPIVDGKLEYVSGNLEHFDSPNLHHWFEKQNRYSTAEANAKFSDEKLAFHPTLFGDQNERRMWLKQHLSKIPFRYFVIFLYCFVVLGTWKAGRVGYIWSRLRSDVYRMREYKFLEMKFAERKKQTLQERGTLTSEKKGWA